MDDDPSLEEVIAALLSADPDGRRASRVFRATFDQLYDGQRTGRFSWNQLHKTEKTHFGTLIEINLRREFDDVIDDGDLLDYLVAGHEVDCKYSFKVGGWMIPPECVGHLVIVCTANDQSSEWALGVVRASVDHIHQSTNRDGKATLNAVGRSAIRWLHWGAEMPPNALLAIDPDLALRLTDSSRPGKGQQRLNDLFRSVQGVRISRNIIATVAQQDDFMKRVRANGGSRTHLAKDGIVILGGDYSTHLRIADELGTDIPEPGEMVSVRLVPAGEGHPLSTEIDGQLWRIDEGNEFAGVPAPPLPRPSRRQAAD